MRRAIDQASAIETRGMTVIGKPIPDLFRQERRMAALEKELPSKKHLACAK
jgi:hypothetical protein